MSEEDTPKHEPESGDSVAPKKVTRKRVAKKATRKRAAKKVAKKAAKKVAKVTEKAPAKKKVSRRDDDDHFDPGDQVSFSFDPDEPSPAPSEPKESPKNDSPKPAEQNQAAQGTQGGQEDRQHRNQNQRHQNQQGGQQQGQGGNQQGQGQGGNQQQGQQGQGGNQQQGQGQGGNQQGGGQHRNQRHKKDFKKKKGQHPNQQHPNQRKQHNQPKKQAKKHVRQQKKKKAINSIDLPNLGELLQDEVLKNMDELKACAAERAAGGEAICLNDYYEMPLLELVKVVEDLGIELKSAPNRKLLITELIMKAVELNRPIHDTGLLWVTEDDGAWLVHQYSNYVPRDLDFYVPDVFIKKYGLKSGLMLDVQVLPQETEGCGYVVDVIKASGIDPEEIQHITPFEDLVPYYPTERILLETPVEDLKNQDVSMRVIDALTPIGFGQRGLIVAPPRTGKTVLLQAIAHSLAANNPDVHLIVLLIDERPEEVTDFRRHTIGEVIASTFDEAADNHVHVSEMVIEKARRMVEMEKHVIILLDSITRLARGYNTTMPNSGKILSGGVEASALQKPKRFFGSARNIEGGGSLTILGTALVDTNSKMDEVVFEEFKGTGNMELHLDRALSDKRIYPAINLEKSGTRKEELLYHEDEMPRIYALRRAMKGVPSTEAMELLINRMKKTSSNVEFLMQVNR